MSFLLEENMFEIAWAELPTRVAGQVIGGIILLLLTLLFSKSVRDYIRYKTVEYDLEAKRTTRLDTLFPWAWNINWESYGILIIAGDISNNKIDNLTFEDRNANKKEIIRLIPSKDFTEIFPKKLSFRIKSIIRAAPADVLTITSEDAIRAATKDEKPIVNATDAKAQLETKYTLKIVLRKPRWR
jgi:hypothetical protein